MWELFTGSKAYYESAIVISTIFARSAVEQCSVSMDGIAMHIWDFDLISQDVDVKDVDITTILVVFSTSF